MRTTFYGGILALSLTVLAGPARAQDYYFMAVLSSQRPENFPRFSHTFAVFARANWCGESWLLQEAFTISWLPRRGPVQPLLPVPEPGRNYDLFTTIYQAESKGERLSMWGPYQIRPDLYQRALCQKTRLESGAVTYKAVDTGWPASRVSNCIHAVSDLSGNVRAVRIASPGWGDPASYYVTLELLPWIINPCQVHDWLFDALGLCRDRIVRRDLRQGHPSESIVLRAAMTAFQPRLEMRGREVRAMCSGPCGP